LNYAIPYFNVNNERALFYVDFIVRMKNGQVFLFDTKTEGSDVNAVKKHNALIDYINSEEIKPQGLKGGVIIESKGNWKFSPLKIANTTDIVSWDCFYPDQYCMK
jgi:type III restriction enzyme